MECWMRWSCAGLDRQPQILWGHVCSSPVLSRRQCLLCSFLISWPLLLLVVSWALGQGRSNSEVLPQPRDECCRIYENINSKNSRVMLTQNIAWVPVEQWFFGLFRRFDCFVCYSICLVLSLLHTVSQNTARKCSTVIRWLPVSSLQFWLHFYAPFPSFLRSLITWKLTSI